MILQEVAPAIANAALAEGLIAENRVRVAGIEITAPLEWEFMDDAIGFIISVPPKDALKAYDIVLSTGILRPFAIREKKKSLKQKIADLWNAL